MLLYLQSGWQGFKRDVVLDLSMISQRLRDKIQDYFAGLIFQRAA